MVRAPRLHSWIAWRSVSLSIIGVLSLITWLWPLEKPVDLPVNPAMNMETSRGAKFCGLVVVLLTVALYVSSGRLAGPMQFFLAGIMQGSHLGEVLHHQGYRERLKQLLAAHFPGRGRV